MSGDAPATAPSAPSPAALDRVALGAVPSFAVNSAAGTLAAALFARWMDGDAYGGFIFAFYVVTILAQVGGLGFQHGAVRFLPRYQHQGEPELYRGYLATGLVAQVVGGALVGLLATGVVILLEGASHSHDALSHAWWLTPLFALNALLASVDRGDGRIQRAAFSRGALRHGLTVLLGFTAFAALGDLGGEEAVWALGAGVGLAVVLQAVGRWRAGDRLAPRRYEVSPWVKVSAAMALLWGFRVLGSSGEVLVLRVVIDETTAGAFHLSTAWAAWAAVPAMAFTAAAGRLIARADGAEAARVAHLSVRRALGPTVFAGLLVLPVAWYFLDHPDTTHRLAEALLVPLVAAWALHGLENVLLSGMSLIGRERQATRLALILTAVSLAVATALAFVGPRAVAWGLLATRALVVTYLLGIGMRHSLGDGVGPTKEE